MIKDVKVSASILCADFANLKDEIRRCEDAGVDMFHVDVMDGHFVPNITVGPLIVEAIRPLTKLAIDAHLMIENPWLYIEDFLKAGADILSLQAECYGPRRAACREFGQYPKEVDEIDATKVRTDIERIHKAGKKVFMVLNPGTPPCLNSLFKDMDGVLVMSVNPGFAKQKFMPVALSKIRQIRQTFVGDIAVDGGVNDLTAPEAVKAGANILATASYFFSSDKPRQLVRDLKDLKRG
jgi:ribulose-phosphate 3-epimerase